jgi:hypothetical protein
MGRLLIWWQGQAGLHLWQIEEIIVLAPHNIRQSRQIRENGSIAILSIQSDYRLTNMERLGLQIGADCLHRLP